MLSDEYQDNTEILISILPSILSNRTQVKVPARDSALDGNSYYLELFNTANANRFRAVARMDKLTFISLLNILKLNSLKKTKTICEGQKLMIFLFTLSGKSNRDAQERWQHSGDTISKTMHNVANSILLIQKDFIRMDVDPGIPTKILNSPKFFPYFQHCIGTIDGTHIPAIVNKNIVAPFRNRKGFVSQNVLAVCDFDMVIKYVLAGWEGSAHDARVFSDAMSKGFPCRAGKYYLGDAGYSLSANVLTPYRGTRYHLKEWGQSEARPANKKELFNLRHSSLRNVIERVFGVMKKRFATLSNMPSFSFSFQVKIVKCIIILHNFVRINQCYEDEFYDYNRSENDNASSSAEFPERNDNEMTEEIIAWRDDMASHMWADYQAHLNARR